MIVAELKGGLGNQMFQYASGLGIALDRGYKFGVDTAWFEENKNITTPRVYELDCFKLNYPIIARSKMVIGSRDNGSGLFNLAKKKLRIYHETSFEYDPLTKQISDNTYIDGYWQSFKYFDNVNQVVRDNFRFGRKLPGSHLAILEKMNAGTSVSLHVRRADYVSNAETSKVHGAMGQDYYSKAIKHIKQSVRDAHFYVFSDDINWCKQNLQIDAPHTYVEGSKNGCDDMNLMSQCNHNIIANSSFSWWAAWLNENEEKIVVAPKAWFLDSSKNTKDLIPSDWIRL